MTKIFISQPFSGRPEEEVMKRQDEIVMKLKGVIPDDIYIIDQYHQDEPSVELGCGSANIIHERLWYLGNSIKLMSVADIIVFSSDYKKAPGCRAEMYIAQSYGLNIMMEEDL